jgi:hypothetical protein
LYVIAGVLLLTLFGGMAIDDTHMHDSLMHRIEEGHFPIVGSFYENLRKSLPDQGIYKGKVVDIGPGSITVKHIDGDGDKDDWTQVIQISHAQAGGVAVGDQVFVYTRPVPGGVLESGIRKVDTTQ